MAGEKVTNSRKGCATSPVVEAKARPTLKTSQLDPTQFIEALSKWNPDNDPKVVPQNITTEALYQRARIPRFINPKKTQETRISGRLITGQGRLTESSGRAIRIPAAHTFAGWDALTKFRESSEGRAKRLRETHGVDLTEQNAVQRWLNLRRNKSLLEVDSFGADGSANVSQFYSPMGPNNEFIPLMLGPFNRNLYLTDFQEQAAKGFWEYNHNPLARAMALLILHFSVGKGITVNFANPLCQEVWDTFVTTTGWHQQIRKLDIELTVIGEGWVYDPILGPPGMTLWDATTVWEIVTNPRNIGQVYYAHRQWPTQWQLMLGTEYLKGAPAPAAQEYVIEQVGPEDWLQVKANATVGEKRGRTEYYAALGWMKSFRDWFNSAVIKGMISNSFMVWWKINGSPQDVDMFKNSSDMNTIPPPGSAWFTNDQVVPTLLQAQAGVGAQDRTGAQLISIIAASMNLNPEYLGVEASATTASSITRSEPGWKTFECRQQLLREVVEWQIGRVMWKARRDGILPQRQPRDAAVRKLLSHLRSNSFNQARAELDALANSELLMDELDMEFDIIFPKLQPEERSQYIKDVQSCEMSGYISHQTAAEQAYEALDMKRVEYETEQEKRRSEQEAGVVPSPQLPDLGGADDGSDLPVEGDSQDTAAYKADNQGRPQ